MKTLFFRFTHFFLALVLLNCSVDAPEVSVSGAEDLRLNKQESIVELVLEKGMGYVDAIPEYDDQDGHSIQFKKFSIDFFVLPDAVAHSAPVTLNRVFDAAYRLPLAPDVVSLPSSPPPEV